MEHPFNPAEFRNIALSEETLWWYRGQRQILRRLLAPHAPAAAVDRPPWLVLEGGCGTGYNSLDLARAFGWRMVPVDLSGTGLRFAQEYGVERLCQSDIARLPFPSDCFDAAVSLDVIVHFPRGEDPAAFAELARVLRPGGLFAVRVSALDILRSRHTEYAGEKQRFTRQRLIQTAEQAGIEVLRCTYVNALLMPVALFKFRIWEPLTGARAASGVQPVAPWLNRILHGALALEERLLPYVDFPAGQSLILVGRKRR